MAGDALLNPQVEATAARAMIDTVTNRLGRLQTELYSNVMDRELYLQKIGAAKELERLQSDLQRTYDRNFSI